MRVVVNSILFNAICGFACAQQHYLDAGSLRACSLIDFHLPKTVSFPGEEQYEWGSRTYWAANQGEYRATCRVTPHNSDEVQRLMYLVSTTNINFAIKSGGHSVVANTSNIAGGVVVDIALLNHVTVNPETLSIDVGAGARWDDVYRELQHLSTDLAAVGPRSGSVGIGGYILGGGLSIFSNEFGWACDQVTFFEVVLANGTMLEASQNSHPELFTVLKGGGSNFGLVTRLGLRLLPSKLINVVTLQYKEQELSAVLKALAKYNAEAGVDSGSASLSLGFDGEQTGIALVLTHHDVASIDLFAPFFSILHRVIISDHWSQRELGIYYDSMNENGFRQFRSTTTIRNDPYLLFRASSEVAHRLSSMLSLHSDGDARGAMLIQPLTLAHLERSNSTGGNMLGLDHEAEPLLLISLEFRYSNRRYDDMVTMAMNQLLSDLQDNAIESGIAHNFRYLNYVAAKQDAFKHIRTQSNCSLLWSSILATKAKYDPENVFGRQIHDPFRIHPGNGFNMAE